MFFVVMFSHVMTCCLVFSCLEMLCYVLCMGEIDRKNVNSPKLQIVTYPRYGDASKLEFMDLFNLYFVPKFFIFCASSSCYF